MSEMAVNINFQPPETRELLANDDEFRREFIIENTIKKTEIQYKKLQEETSQEQMDREVRFE